MGLTGEKKKTYQREYMKRKRSNSGSNKIRDLPEGLTSYPDIIDKLTDKKWRNRLEDICNSFQSSHHPSYVNEVFLGDLDMGTVCDLVECTR